jgi:hypothetical protein
VGWEGGREGGRKTVPSVVRKGRNKEEGFEGEEATSSATFTRMPIFTQEERNREVPMPSLPPSLLPSSDLKGIKIDPTQISVREHLLKRGHGSRIPFPDGVKEPGGGGVVGFQLRGREEAGEGGRGGGKERSNMRFSGRELKSFGEQENPQSSLPPSLPRVLTSCTNSSVTAVTESASLVKYRAPSMIWPISCTLLLLALAT